MHIYRIYKNGTDEPICRAGTEMQTAEQNCGHAGTEMQTAEQNCGHAVEGRRGWDETRVALTHIHTAMCRQTAAGSRRMVQGAHPGTL